MLLSTFMAVTIKILPNATEVVQNFYGAEFAHVRTQNNGMEEKEEDEAVRIARGTLCNLLL